MHTSIAPCARNGVLALLCLVFVVTPLAAQSIRGVVVQQDGATLARGIVVLVVGRDNRVAGRALTSATGAFDVKLQSAGSYTVRALRIGFRPTDVGPFDLAGDSLHVVRVVLRAEPIALEAVTVLSPQTCRSTGDGTAVAAAWLQARTALTAAAITAESEAFVSRYVTWDRVASDVDSIVTYQRSSVAVSARPKVFTSAPADSLARVGYAFIANDEFVYLGPDADVLLSDQFAGAHCFRLGPGPDAIRRASRSSSSRPEDAGATSTCADA
ncbi:MAG: carboxypeptidase regulatory-like domain-containing protein [Cytophagaceae bacterium]|nr:carboxypeptidase regulatory-like domain-containing protein [Gemmatimonadaceae bacterium]